MRIYPPSFLALAAAALCLLPTWAASPPGLPTPCPALGLTLNAELVRVRDADTIEWRVPGSAFVWASRLIDVWAPETDSRDPALKEIAVKGKAFAKAQCEQAVGLRVYIPLPKGPQPLKGLTFDRIPSWVYLDDTTTLNELVVRNGFASRKKGGELGL